VKDWEPQKGESFVAVQALNAYLGAGADRSTRAVAQLLGKSLTQIGRWSSRWDWVNRAIAYDAHMAAIEQRGRERALENDAEEWARTQRRVASALIDKSEKMLAFPLATQKSKDGQTIVEPARWGFGDAAKLSDTGIKLGRLARGESTDNLNVTDKRQTLAESLGLPLETINLALPVENELNN